MGLCEAGFVCAFSFSRDFSCIFIPTHLSITLIKTKYRDVPRKLLSVCKDNVASSCTQKAARLQASQKH
jgi:hypothetical protein